MVTVGTLMASVSSKVWDNSQYLSFPNDIKIYELRSMESFHCYILWCNAVDYVTCFIHKIIRNVLATKIMKCCNSL